MAYSIALDVKNEYPDVLLLKLTDDTGTGNIQDAEITRAIAWGENMFINPYCCERYNLPFSPVPDQVKAWSIMLAWHRLHQRYGDAKKTQATFDSIVGTEDEPGQLRLVQAGKLPIYGADAQKQDIDYYHTYMRREMPDIGLDDNLDATYEEEEDD